MAYSALGRVEEDLFGYFDSFVDELTEVSTKNADVLAEQVNLALPMKVICSSDCRGLCPHCGANLNNEECRCEKNGADPRMAPLARLKQDWFKKQ